MRELFNTYIINKGLMSRIYEKHLKSQRKKTQGQRVEQGHYKGENPEAQ